MSETFDLRVLARYMTQQSLRLVTAESCTAGLIAAMIGDMPGSGQWFEGALVTYSPNVKRDVAGVARGTIERYGLTSIEVAREMAEGALSRTDAHIAVANTGLADASPDASDPPAGTQCFAWAIRADGHAMPRVFTETHRFEGERNDIRQAAARHALSQIEPYHRRARSDAARVGVVRDADDRATWRASQARVIAELGVARDFDAPKEVARRVDFLCDYLIAAKQHAYVLGISGGVDSTTAGRLAQLACERARKRGHAARFYAVRLPYGEQDDEVDARRALEFVRADEVLTVNVKPSADAMLASLRDAKVAFKEDAHADFVLGNIKARERMIAQYAIAGTVGGLVIGTDHAAEALMGFFTKFGDGAADVVPLAGLNKRRVRALAEVLGASRALSMKIPTADLETLAPQRPDEDAYGITYAQIDDFLEGEQTSAEIHRIIMRFYDGTRHKRALPVAP